MLEDVRAFEFYYDSDHGSPKEDPALVHDRLQAVADREAIAYERIDTAGMTDDERRSLYQETVGEIRAGREYHVGNRIFTGGSFGGLRPALVIRYEDGAGVDVYPHRNDAVGTRPVGVLDFLDEVEDGTDTDHGDYALIRAVSGEDREEEPEVGSGPGADAASDGLLAGLRSRLPL